MKTPDAALDVVDELESGAALPRLDAQVHLAELAGAAALLLVAEMALGAALYGLAVGNLRRRGGHLQLVLLRHLLQLVFQVHLAEAADHRLVGRRVALDAEAGVLQLQPVQHVEQALLVALALRLDGEAQHRPGEIERPEVDVVLLVRVVQHGVELDLIDLAMLRAPTSSSTSMLSLPCNLYKPTLNGRRPEPTNSCYLIVP